MVSVLAVFDQYVFITHYFSVFKILRFVLEFFKIIPPGRIPGTELYKLFFLLPGAGSLIDHSQLTIGN